MTKPATNVVRNDLLPVPFHFWTDNITCISQGARIRLLVSPFKLGEGWTMAAVRLLCQHC